MTYSPNNSSQELSAIGLKNGDQVSREEFHRLYEAMSENFRAELIDGTVYVAQPLGLPHAGAHMRLSSLLDMYRAFTLGLEACDNATVILSQDDEVQPDLLLRILPAFGGQSKTTYENYIEGAPELVAEIAHSSRAIDLNRKLRQYAKFGVLEYLVLCLWPASIYWYDFRQSPLQTKVADSSGTFKSSVFPGLWIHEESLLSMDYQKSVEVLQQGLASFDHGRFVDRLKTSKQS